jgi:hypothetical protein
MAVGAFNVWARFEGTVRRSCHLLKCAGFCLLGNSAPLRIGDNSPIVALVLITEAAPVCGAGPPVSQHLRHPNVISSKGLGHCVVCVPNLDALILELVHNWEDGLEVL